jgi:type I restriction enzyme M protein
LKPLATQIVGVLAVAGIDAAVCDLKAVNPHSKAITDMHTVLEIIGNINLQGQVVATAMNNLRGLL